MTGCQRNGKRVIGKEINLLRQTYEIKNTAAFGRRRIIGIRRGVLFE
uniref:Uncharacterized protein n=1 Tax=uncultured bacterium contig00021 TaxID=1181511 RepID=A0A806KSG0_9BACT|nr:hypothetical protein [uncultured bacterium contig00021]